MDQQQINLSQEEINEISSYPKIELHCHLDGSLPKKIIKMLAEEAQIEIPQIEKEFEKIITITNDCQQLMDCFKLFDFPIQLLQTYNSIKMSVLGLMEEAKKDNIKYIEIRFAPQLHTQKGLTIDEILQASIEGLNEAKTKLSIEGGIIICALGDYSSEKSIELFKTAQKFLGKGIVGVDLARVFNEHMNHVETFQVAKELGFQITIHAGEFPPAQTVLDCLTKLKSDRIGHGVYSALDESIIDYLQKNQIPLEICLTSNIHSGKFTQGFQKYQDHYVKKLFDSGVKITINCDNRTISNTNLNKEFCLLKEYFGFNKKQFLDIYINSVEAAFASQAVKQQLLEFRKEYQ